MNDKNVGDILNKLASDEIPADIPGIVEKISNDFTRNAVKTRRSKHRVWWETIMRSKTAKLAAAAVIVCAVLFGVFQFGGSMESVAWGALVERIQQAHDDQVAQLLRAVEAKDAEKVGYYADMLGEFWQNLNWLARAHGDPQSQAQLIAEAQARIEGRPEDDDEIGIGIFLAHADEFINWLGKIEDAAWIDETIHVCKQLEEYLEEIRDGARSQELGWPYIEHCLPSFLAYCHWFKQLPWDHPGRDMAAAVLLAGIQRDLEIADREIRNPLIRGGHRWVKRGLQRAQKNAEILARRPKSEPTSSDARTRLSRRLAQNLNSTIDLVTFTGIATWDLQQAKGIGYNEAARRVLEREFGGQGPLGDYLLGQIGKLLGLCRDLAEGPEST